MSYEAVYSNGGITSINNHPVARRTYWASNHPPTPAPMNDAGITAKLPSRKGKTVKLRGGGPFQGPNVPLADALSLPHHALLAM